MQYKQVGIILAACATVVAVAFSCGEKSDDKSKENTANNTNTDASDGADSDDTDGATTGGNTIGAGQIALTFSTNASAGLTAGGPTHVIATDTDTNETTVVEIKDDSQITLPLEKEASYVLTFIDDTKSGADMLVSTFGSGELNSIPTTEASKNLDLGVVDVSGETAAAATSGEALMTAAGVSAEAAVTWGAIDDAALRVSNPDIDGDGKVDAASNQKFPLDFHNRFNVVNETGGAMAMKDLKNAFPPENADVQFLGSGIIPWFEDSVYTTPLDKYEWTFSVDSVLGGSGGIVCEGMAGGDTLPANTVCKMTASDGASGGKKPSIELAQAVEGTYKLVAGGKTFTWPKVKVSDFTGGKGFLALFIRMDVSTENKLTGVSHKWMIKKADGTWRLAAKEEVELIVSGGRGYISLKVDGMNSGKELGVMVPSDSEGSVVFANAVFSGSGGGGGGGNENANVMLPSSGVTEADVKAGIEWTRVLENPGISYDDKLGMRFFMGFTGPNN
jgi:hypothetical protein